MLRPQPLPHQDAAALASVDEVFVQRGGDGEHVAVELVEAHLIGAGPILIPGNIERDE